MCPAISILFIYNTGSMSTVNMSDIINPRFHDHYMNQVPSTLFSVFSFLFPAFVFPSDLVGDFVSFPQFIYSGNLFPRVNSYYSVLMV